MTNNDNGNHSFKNDNFVEECNDNNINDVNDNGFWLHQAHRKPSYSSSL